MKINKKSIVVAFLVLAFFTVLPRALLQQLPSEFLNAFSRQGGFDLMALLDKIAVLGLATAILVLLKGLVEKTAQAGLAVSIIWKFLMLAIVLFALGLGNIESMGLATLGSEGNGASNIVVFDFRLFTVLATIIVALTIIRLVLEFKEAQTSQPIALKAT